MARVESAKELAVELVDLLRTIPPYLIPEDHEVDLLVEGLAFVGMIRTQYLLQICAILCIDPPFEWDMDYRPLYWTDICRRVCGRRRARYNCRFSGKLREIAPDLQYIVLHACQVLSGLNSSARGNVHQMGRLEGAMEAYCAKV